MILKTLSDLGTVHGLEIARHIEHSSSEVLQVEEGALYPALHRLRSQGLVEAEWRISDRKRRARYYEITAAGKQALVEEMATWRRRTEAVNRVLGLGDA
jgi:transcriptional regulator